MAELSDRLSLPLLSAGQAQKELYHNEALATLDLLSHAAVEDHGINTPPSTPSVGQCWVVGASPTGVWAGHADAIAGWTSGGWRFIAPRAGMLVWDIGASYWLHHDGGNWVTGAFNCFKPGNRRGSGGRESVSGNSRPDWRQLHRRRGACCDHSHSERTPNPWHDCTIIFFRNVQPNPRIAV